MEEPFCEKRGIYAGEADDTREIFKVAAGLQGCGAGAGSVSVRQRERPYGGRQGGHRKSSAGGRF